MKTIAIIGSSPVCLFASLKLKTNKSKVYLFEKNNSLGGAWSYYKNRNGFIYKSTHILKNYLGVINYFKKFNLYKNYFFFPKKIKNKKVSSFFILNNRYKNKSLCDWRNNWLEKLISLLKKKIIIKREKVKQIIINKDKLYIKTGSKTQNFNEIYITPASDFSLYKNKKKIAINYKNHKNISYIFLHKNFNLKKTFFHFEGKYEPLREVQYTDINEKNYKIGYTKVSDDYKFYSKKSILKFLKKKNFDIFGNSDVRIFKKEIFNNKRLNLESQNKLLKLNNNIILMPFFKKKKLSNQDYRFSQDLSKILNNFFLKNFLNK
jgi:hypothetical protein